MLKIAGRASGTNAQRPSPTQTNLPSASHEKPSLWISKLILQNRLQAE